MKHKITHLLLLALFSGPLFGQSPGGVSSPELWFITRPAGSDLGGAYRWVDHSGDSLRLNTYSDEGAAHGTEFTTTDVRHYNGWPALSMTKLLDPASRNVELKRSNLSQATIIGVFSPSNNFEREMLLYGLYGRPGQGVYLTNSKIIPSVESGKEKFDYGETEGMDIMYSGNDAEPTLDLFKESSMRIAAYYRSIPPATGLWGERDKAVFTFGAAYRQRSNVNESSTFSMSTAENRAFTGYIPEFIAYNRLITPLERRKVDTYLAVKYGLTLPVSYIGSSGHLLWDRAEAPAYNHRITGLLRDEASGLCQREAATSCEEAPNFSYSSDYYQGANPYNRSSSSRLLVIGRQDASPLSADSYLLWGDDNQPFTVKPVEGKAGYQIMERTWKVVSNMPATDPADRYLSWNTQDLDLSASGFVCNISKPSDSSTPATGTAVTALPLLEKDGYLGLTNLSILADTYIKFGTLQPALTAGSHDYGYYISGLEVYPIVRGVKGETSVLNLLLVTRLEVEKKDDHLCLRSNGTLLPATRIEIEAQDRDKPYYGAIGMSRGALGNSLSLRYGGFTDTGNRIELSYATSRAADFRDNDKGRSFLLIDRTGTGNFDLDTVEMIEVDETSTTRQKAIFNNVFLSDGDVFTFLYRASDLTGDIEITDPGCNEASGEIALKIKSGNKAFDYTLTDLSSGEVVRSGKEYTYSIHLDGLRGGEYELKVTESGGFNFTTDAQGGKMVRAKTTNFLPVFEGGLQWNVSNTTDTYMIGYTTFIENVNNPGNIIHYGLKKQGNLIYKVVSGKLEATNITVEPGDVLRITKNMSKVRYLKNGVEFSSNSIKWYDYMLKFYGLVDMSEGPAELLNVQAEGFFNLADYNWSKTDGITIDHSRDAVMTHRFTLTDPCSSTPEPEPEAEEPAQEDTRSGESNLSVIYTPKTRTVTARVTLEEPDVVTFTVFSVSGTLVQKTDIPVPRKIQETDFSFSGGGVYIIKAITTQGEYTRKISIH